MRPLLVIEEPFSRIGMDIIGPLPKSRTRSIDAEYVADELVTVFSRVGVPWEILTDQGTNFTSQLLSELYCLLHVHPICTTPNHPQTDGLMERINQTLKSMLRKTARTEGKDWDKLLSYLLFAYREVPQSSKGFLPFELLYGLWTFCASCGKPRKRQMKV